MNEKDMRTKNSQEGMSRREFIGAITSGIGAIGIMGVPSVVSALEDLSSRKKAILFDSTKCIACHECEEACKKANQLEGEIATNGDLSADNWLKVTMTEITPIENTTEPIFIFNRFSCRHCGACVQVCPTKALTQREDGIVIMNPEKCIGCHYCIMACPFNVPRYGADGAMRKCNFCSTPPNNRLELGLEPACVAFCPEDALTFGYRDDLVEDGRERVAELKEDGYKDAYLYGEKELGGTQLMYVLPYSFSNYGLPKLPLEAQNPVTLKDFGMPVGIIAGLAALTFGGISYIKGRGEKAVKGEDSKDG